MPSRDADSPDTQALAAGMRKVALAPTAEARAGAFRDLAARLNETGQGEAFLSRVLARSDANARRFALEVAARLKPLPSLLAPSLVSLLGKSKYPSRLRVAVAANVINHVPADSPLIPQIIAGLERKAPSTRAADRLSQLMELIPPLEAVRRRRQELLEQSLSTCPRCGVRLPLAEFVRHLWESHRLRFEGGRVQEPWQVVENWVNEFHRRPRGELLDRACELATSLDPAGGVGRVNALLAAGESSIDQHQTLRTLAAEQQASVCPHCFAVVPFPTPAEPTQIMVAGGLLLGGEFRMEVRDRFLFNWLDAAVGDSRLYGGPEPGHALTRRGVVCLFILPLVLVAGVAAVMPPLAGVAPQFLVGGLLLLAALSYMGIRLHWGHEEPPADRVIDHAWNFVIPRMLRTHDLPAADQMLFAGLADATVNHGDAEYREKTLGQAIAQTGDLGWADALSASLMALKLEDRDEGADDVPMLAGQFADVCAGKATWGAANRLFLRMRGDLANRTRRAKLRILLLRAAFQAGLEAGDLRRLGRLAPEVGVCYASEDRAGLARLRLLWLYRANRLWQTVGAAASVFDLAQYAQSYLEQRPDLLLLQPAPNADEAPILICEEGVVYRESVLASADARVAVRAKTGGGFDLLLNNQRYPFKKNPAILVQRLTAWRAFLFEEFLPRADILQRRTSDLGDRLLNRHRRECGACGRDFYGLPGGMGLSDMPEDEDDE